MFKIKKVLLKKGRKVNLPNPKVDHVKINKRNKRTNCKRNRWNKRGNAKNVCMGENELDECCIRTQIRKNPEIFCVSGFCIVFLELFSI